MQGCEEEAFFPWGYVCSKEKGNESQTIRLRFSGVLALAVCVVFSCPGCKNPTTNPGGVDTEVTVTFSGIITQNGAPLAGVTVYLSWAGSKTTTTGADGKYSFGGLDATGYGRIRFFITPARIGTAFSPSNYEVGGMSKTDANFTASPASYGTEAGSIVAPFTAANQSGGSFNLADHFGRVILMDFASDGSAPCQERAQKAEALYQKYKNRGFTYILIVIQGSAASWASTYGLTFPVLDDNAQMVYSAFRKSSIPLPIILDRNMTIRYKVEGFNQTDIEYLLNQLL